MKHVPSIVLIELDDIKREEQIETDADAFKLMTKHARVGREVQRLMRLDWSSVKPLPPIETNKKRKCRSIF